MPKISYKGSAQFKAYFALACVCFFWGTTYLALRVGVASIPPFLFSGVRQVSAGIILITYFLIKGYKIPKGKALRTNFFSGFLMITIGNGFVAWAELYVTSGLAALICSLVPIWIILINLLIGGSEKANFKVLAGVTLGFLGLAIIFSDNLKDFANRDYAFGIAAIMVANLSWAVGTVINKNNTNNLSPLLAAGLQIFFGGLFLLLLSLFTENFSGIKIDLPGGMSLLYLIFFGSILAFGAYIYSLSKLPTTIVSMYAYINPLVAIFFGWLILGEELNMTIGVAFLITISGVYLVNRGLVKKQLAKE